MVNTEQKINERSIKVQVNRILNADLFTKSKILSAFLSFIVSETLQGNEDYLKEYVIAINVLKRSPDFNPQLDAVVRIHANRLRKSLDSYYLNESEDNLIRITIPKGRYVPHFEFMSQDVGSSLTQEISRDLVSKPVIAVLPFGTAQNSSKLDVICSVLCQDLSVELTKFDELDVVAHYSISQVDDLNITADDLIDHLGVNFVLTGNCYLNGNQASISVTLNSTFDKKILWAESYIIEDVEHNELSRFREIIHEIIGVTCGYFGVVFRNTLCEKVPQNYDYLYAIHLHHNYHQKFNEESFHEALKAVEIGLIHNPNNPLLLAFKGELFLNLISMDVQGEIDYLKIGTELVQLALSLDPTCQHANQVMAWSNILHHDEKAAIRSLERMVEINPNNCMFQGQAGFGYSMIGHYEEGLSLMSEAISLNPYYMWSINLGFCLYYLAYSEYDEALYWAKKINRSGLLWDPILRCASLGHLGKLDEAEDVYKELLDLTPDFQEREKEIINTFLLDKKLQKTILEGLNVARMSIKLPLKATQ